MRSKRFFSGFLLFGFCILLISCVQEGKLEITLDLEQQESTLNPLRHPSLSAFTLTVATENYEDKSTEFYYSGRHRLDFGSVDVGTYSRIALTANSFFGATLAYGEVRGRFRIGAQEPTRVEIPLRYPFVYAAGGYGLPPLHPELDTSMARFMNIPVGVSPDTTSAVAVSPDGTLLVSATDNHSGSIKLWVLMTRNHKKLVDTSISRSAPIDRIAFSPDGKTLSLLSFSGGWVGFVDMDALVSGRSVMVFADLSQPLDGQFVDSQNFVVLQSVPYAFSRCETQPPPSNLVWFTVNRRSAALETQIARSVPVSGYAAAMTVDTVTRRVYAALSCSPEIVVVETGATQTASVLSALNLSPCLRPVQLAVGNSDLLVACATTVDTTNPQWSPAKLLVQRYALRPQLNPNSRTLMVDYPWEPFLLNDSEDPFHNEASVLMQLAPVRLLPRAVGMTAAGSRVMLAVEAYHHTEEFSISTTNTTMYFEAVSIKSHSVVFVDARVAQMGRRVRTACFEVSSPDDNEMPAGLAPDDDCSVGTGSFDVTPVSFIPKQLAIMFAAP